MRFGGMLWGYCQFLHSISAGIEILKYLIKMEIPI